jgi:hypothetical protein
MKRLIIAGLLLCAVLPARAWWPKGHSLLTHAAILALPPSRGANEGAPDFFRAGWQTIAHTTQDPDVWKNRDAPHLSDRESSDHYFDWEAFGDLKLPDKRSAYMALCLKNNLDPEEIGTLPYSLMESTEKLTLAFAEYRKWPQNPHIRLKCLVYAGQLAHYAQDLQMPLHVTIHHDGRAKADGKSPRSGIHARLDSLIEKLAERHYLGAAFLAQNQTLEPLEGKLLPAVIKEMEASRAYVDRAYELEAVLPPSDEKIAWHPDEKVVQFGIARGREATRFTSTLFLSAWRRSANVKLPVWLEREG